MYLQKFMEVSVPILTWNHVSHVPTAEAPAARMGVQMHMQALAKGTLD